MRERFSFLFLLTLSGQVSNAVQRTAKAVALRRAAYNTLQWHWGEWWNYGHQNWDRDAEEFIKTLPLKRKTLQNFGSVCTLVKPSLRMEGLPYAHHALIAPLHEEPKEQKKWLKRAKDNKWLVYAERPVSSASFAYALPELYKGFENRQSDLLNPLKEYRKRRGKAGVNLPESRAKDYRNQQRTN